MQVGRAMEEMGVQMIPAYSPQARAQRTQLRHLARVLAAGVASGGDHHGGGGQRILQERYIAEFIDKFTAAAREKGTASRKTLRADLDWIFTVQTERVVAK